MAAGETKVVTKVLFDSPCALPPHEVQATPQMNPSPFPIWSRVVLGNERTPIALRLQAVMAGRRLVKSHLMIGAQSVDDLYCSWRSKS